MFLQMINLEIKERRIGEIVVLDMEGQIRIGGGSIVVRTTIRRLVEEGNNKILLNLAGVSNIDSSGLGELVSSHISLSKKGGEMKLLHLTQSLRELMTITKLLTVFDVYEDEAKALASFKGST
jgi:anti-sigma B factor antagonist